jgi:vacuolar protein 8
MEDNQKLFMSDEWNVIGLVLFLDTWFLGVAKQFPIVALHALACNEKCRKQMITTGACYHLYVLANMEITRAKQLLDRLIIGKLWRFMIIMLFVNMPIYLYFGHLIPLDFL